MTTPSDEIAFGRAFLERAFKVASDPDADANERAYAQAVVSAVKEKTAGVSPDFLLDLEKEGSFPFPTAAIERRLEDTLQRRSPQTYVSDLIKRVKPSPKPTAAIYTPPTPPTGIHQVVNTDPLPK